MRPSCERRQGQAPARVRAVPGVAHAQKPGARRKQANPSYRFHQRAYTLAGSVREACDAERLHAAACLRQACVPACASRALPVPAAALGLREGLREEGLRQVGAARAAAGRARSATRHAAGGGAAAARPAGLRAAAGARRAALPGCARTASAAGRCSPSLTSKACKTRARWRPAGDKPRPHKVCESAASPLRLLCALPR